ncbi:MAG: stage III sporulation protein AD [Firmicutes bacterium]|nr:stage III sporulation protein AD [Bacillota bacterium]
MDHSILTVSALGLMGLCLTLILRQYDKEMSILISAVISIFLMLFVLEHLRSFLGLIDSYLKKIQGGSFYLSILVKVLLTAYTADFTAQLCKDAGETSIAGKVELAGKIIICILASPIIVSVLEMISKLI